MHTPIDTHAPICRGGRPPTPPTDPDQAVEALALSERTTGRLRRARLDTLRDVEAVGADGMLALGLGRRTVEAVARALRRLGRDLPGVALRGAPRVSRQRCPVCGWRGCRARARIGAPCPVCGAGTLGPRRGALAKRDTARLVRAVIYLPPELAAQAFGELRGPERARRVRELLALGLQASKRLHGRCAAP